VLWLLRSRSPESQRPPGGTKLAFCIIRARSALTSKTNIDFYSIFATWIARYHFRPGRSFLLACRRIKSASSACRYASAISQAWYMLSASKVYTRSCVKKSRYCNIYFDTTLTPPPIRAIIFMHTFRPYLG